MIYALKVTWIFFREFRHQQRLGHSNSVAWCRAIENMMEHLSYAVRGFAHSDGIARCEVCDWPLADSIEHGCVPGNCSYRPREGSEEYRRIKKRRAELEAKAADSKE